MQKQLQFSFTFFLLIFKVIYAQESIIKSKPVSVEVYLSQALIKHHTSNFNLTKGDQWLVVQDIATSVIPNTIQISGSGNFVILSSQFQLNYITPKNISKKIQQLQDSLESLQYKKNILDIQIKTYDDEENLLLSNKNIGGQNTGVSATELEKISALYRTKLVDIRSKKLELSNKTKMLKEQIDNIQKQLNELNTQKNKPTGEILIQVHANENINNAQLFIEYICNNASWTPEYEIRINDLKQPAQLLLKAQIIQNTGIDWNNIQLSLSTSSPDMNHDKPQLFPWWISFYQPQPYTSAIMVNEPEKKLSKAPLKNKRAEDQINTDIAQIPDAESSTQYTQATEKYTTQQFQIQLPVNIASNNHPTRIDVKNTPIQANYIYYTVPKIRAYGYLIAEIPDWEKYNLMSGPLYIFLENAYIGQSHLNTQITNDTLQLSLGIDKNISVKREIIKKFNEKKIIGNARKEIQAYEISIKNKKRTSVDIIIEDQIPLSSTQEIDVELLENSNATYDKTTGKLIWKLTLNADEEKKLIFKYSVKYPKDKIINL